MTKQSNLKRVRVGVDTGGTFTDFVYDVGGRAQIFKLASTPADSSRAITEGLKRVAEETGVRLRDIEVIHGTTVGTNALLERRGARTALVTTAGFEDVLAIGRQTRPRLYDLNVTRPETLVPRELRFGARERVAASGEVLEALDESALAALVKKLKHARAQSIAVSLLFSFVRPEHEQRIAAALETLGVPLSVSHVILPEYREYERTSTVVINAYLQPLMGAYLKRLNNEVPRLRVMQSSGGGISAEIAAREPVRTILSGPASGVVGALGVARAAGAADIITFDMGGTSTDVALCAAGEVRLTNESTIAGMPIAVPVMDIHTVGAGGGSIARIDLGGSLRVGPESAGADPGPACYGRGTLPTVTDANLLLGRFGGADLLGGDFRLDVKRAEQALTKLAREMSAASGRKVGANEAALGVVRVVNAGMERALRAVSVERGYDPREFSLLPFGGAGGLHAVELARHLRIPRVIVPRDPGALSARGALDSDVIKDLSRTVMLKATDDYDAQLERAFRAMEREARAALKREGFTEQSQRHERAVAARYLGQSFELTVKWARGGRELAAAFHQAHRSRYGYAREENTVEIVSARVRAIGIVEKSTSGRAKRRGNEDGTSPTTRAHVCFEHHKKRIIAVYARDQLTAGARLESPSIITEYSSTTLIPPGARAEVDRYGNLIIEP